jgi:hypothetical protein
MVYLGQELFLMNGFDYILLFFDRIYRIYWILSISSPPASPERLAMAGRRKLRKTKKYPDNPVYPV